MKIRNGFVSNSSSSSFCIYGTYLNYDDVVEMLKESNSLTEEELEEFEEDGDVYSFFEGKTSLEVYSSEGDVWIGKSWSSIEDDQTGREFKESVKNELEKLLGEGVECSTHEEEIYS